MITPEMREIAKRALALDDDALMGACDVDVFIAGGPGGQHRNKTESGVRLVHRSTGTVVVATERRSQLDNKRVALERLRLRLEQITFVPKPRRPTKPSKAAKRRRVEAKRHTSVKKQNRSSTDD